MWLLHAHTHQLHWFNEGSTPPYAILSHTWNQDEVTFGDMPGPYRAAVKQKAGFQKINLTCKQAVIESLEFVWIDTCCINKDSSAELSEAINSMFRWYLGAAVCYVFLEDLESAASAEALKISGGTNGMARKFYYDNDGGLTWYTGRLIDAEHGIASWTAEDHEDHANVCGAAGKIQRCASTLSASMLSNELRKCRWFSRGWTLQELIAPRSLKFYSRRWDLLGHREDLLDSLEKITGIDRRILNWAGDGDRTDGPRALLDSYSIAQRMSWASRRTTSRKEDEAYALMGIFDINMPLLYGEGAKAFVRLQEEIIKVSTDHSILSWTMRLFTQGTWSPILENAGKVESSLFAQSPKFFQDGGRIEVRSNALKRHSFEMTNLGLRIDLPVLKTGKEQLFVLSCGYEGQEDSLIVVPFAKHEGLYSFVRDGAGLRQAQVAEVSPAQSVTVMRHAPVQTLRSTRRSNPDHGRVLRARICKFILESEYPGNQGVRVEYLQSFPVGSRWSHASFGGIRMDVPLSNPLVAVRLWILSMRKEILPQQPQTVDVFLAHQEEVSDDDGNSVPGRPGLKCQLAPGTIDSLGTICASMTSSNSNGWTFPYCDLDLFKADGNGDVISLHVSALWFGRMVKNIDPPVGKREVHLTLRRRHDTHKTKVEDSAAATAMRKMIFWGSSNNKPSRFRAGS